MLSTKTGTEFNFQISGMLCSSFLNESDFSIRKTALVSRERSFLISLCSRRYQDLALQDDIHIQVFVIILMEGLLSTMVILDDTLIIWLYKRVFLGSFFLFFKRWIKSQIWQK